MRGPNQKPTERARSFRREQTLAESKLWACLRNRQLGGAVVVGDAAGDRLYTDMEAFKSVLAVAASKLR